MRITVVACFLFTACASKPPLVAPQWDVVPPHISDALCTRLKMDAIATGSIAIVNVTQPLATSESLAALRVTTTKIGARETTAAPPVNRAIPIVLGQSCDWKEIGALDIRKHPDEMVVELSNPVVNAGAREVGMFARASLGGELPQWYWVALAPVGNQWAVRFIFVLSK